MTHSTRARLMLFQPSTVRSSSSRKINCQLDVSMQQDYEHREHTQTNTTAQETSKLRALNIYAATHMFHEHSPLSSSSSFFVARSNWTRQGRWLLFNRYLMDFCQTANLVTKSGASQTKNKIAFDSRQQTFPSFPTNSVPRIILRGFGFFKFGSFFANIFWESPSRRVAGKKAGREV